MPTLAAHSTRMVGLRRHDTSSSSQPLPDGREGAELVLCALTAGWPATPLDRAALRFPSDRSPAVCRRLVLVGFTVGIDATTLEANAVMRSIERRDSGESYEAFIRRLAEASGVETPTRADLARFDRSRKNKKTSNKEWKSPQDPDAKIAKMKDGRTHLAHKAEHGVDMDTGAIVSVTVQDASDGDTATLPETLIMAAEQVEAVQPEGAGVEEVVADKGYHSDETLVALGEVGVRSHVSEPERGRRCWQECARLTGGGWPVRVRQEEGVTNHLHPESCARRCEAAGEALTGARTGRAIEHRKNRGSGAPRLFLRSKATPTSPRW